MTLFTFSLHDLVNVSLLLSGEYVVDMKSWVPLCICIPPQSPLILNITVLVYKRLYLVFSSDSDRVDKGVSFGLYGNFSHAKETFSGQMT